MTHQSPSSRAAAADWLSAQVEQFLSQGGKAEVVPIGRSKDFNPVHAGPRQPDGTRPPRKHPPAKAKAKPKLTAAEAKRQQWEPIVVQMFDEGAPMAKIVRETGLGKTFVLGRLEAAGRDTGTNRKKRTDPVLIQQARAMAAERYTARYAAEILSTAERSVSERTLLRMAKDNDFEFVRSK